MNVDPSGDAVGIQAKYAIRSSFERSGFAPATLKFFDELVALLTGGDRH
jgi:hypothetical protein